MVSRLSLWMWVPVLACLLVFVGAGRAEAEEGLASWYGSEVAGNPTASGDIYDPMGYTAASRTLPFGTQLVVNYNGASVQVTVNDRGPAAWTGRDLDLSQGAAEAIGFTAAGVDYVEYYPVGTAPGYETYRQPQPETYEQPRAKSVQTDPATDTTSATATADGGEYEVAYEGGSGATPGTTASGTTPSETTASGSVDSGATPAAGGAHLIQYGETLSGISFQLGVSVEYLASVNGIADPDVIYAGQTLYF